MNTNVDKNKIIPGRLIADKINLDTKGLVVDMIPKPRLGIVLASNDESSHTYVELKMKKAKDLGIETKLYHFGEDTLKEELITEIRKFKNNEAIHGVLIQLPFYNHLERYETKIINSLDPIKDCDGLTAVQQGMSSQMISDSILPAAVEATLECLNYCFDEDLSWDNLCKNYKSIKSLEGKKVLIINNTNLVGKPLSMILSNLNATVTIANSYSSNLKELCLTSDIIVSATGKGEIIDHTMIKKNAILIDITSEKKGNRVVGDFIWTDELIEKCKFITPVPGGIGPLTIACLLRNLTK